MRAHPHLEDPMFVVRSRRHPLPPALVLLAVLSVPAAGLCESAAEPPPADPAAVAAAEYDQVMALTPDIDNGRRAYLTCAVCHLPEGWGSIDGSYPQIAGQLRTVIIKQLADFRAGNRDNPLMYPFSVPSILGGPQEMADVAAYVAALPMTADNGLGPGTDLERGAQLYREQCMDCHGPAGEGDVQDHIPALAGQHYAYLVHQFDQIRAGERRNADSKMTKQIEHFTAADESAVLDYTSRLRPPADKLAPPGWTNPDFPSFVRDAAGIRATPPATP
jgi:cytochrome c553